VRAIACVVLPTFNEAENVSVLLPRIFSQSAAIAHELHVIVVDDGSPDGTADRVRQAQQEFPNLHLLTGARRGLGDAYIRGITHALHSFQPEIIIQMDADLQHDAAHLPEMIRLTSEGYDVVIGSRFAPGGSIPGFPLWRKLISLAGGHLVRGFARIPHVHDCTSGYRAIKAELLPQCDLDRLSTRGYSFQSSLLCELLWNGSRVKEIPITFGDRLHGESKLEFRDQWEFLVNLLRLRSRRAARERKPPDPLIPQAVRSPGSFPEEDFAETRAARAFRRKEP
jgi:dolichol-phosphate mannosyltransferase